MRGGAGTVLWHRTPEYYAKRPWRGQRALSGGGVMINQAIHTLDLARLRRFNAERPTPDDYATRMKWIAPALDDAWRFIEALPPPRPPP